MPQNFSLLPNETSDTIEQWNKGYNGTSRRPIFLATKMKELYLIQYSGPNNSYLRKTTAVFNGYIMP